MKNSLILRSASLLSSALTLGFVLVAAGCGAGSVDGGGGDNSGTGGDGKGSGGLGTSTGGSGFDIGSGGSGNGKASDDRDLPVREKVCDAEGKNCTCLKLALLGTLESAASDKDAQPFIDWLNGNSGGTAVVTMVSTKPTVDDAFLANYDILIVANVNGWTFTQAEKDAITKWSHELGGGIISLTGFVSTASEPGDTSQLIQFSGISYTSTRSAENGQGLPVTYQGGTTDLKSCLHWANNTGDPQITTPISFADAEGQMEKLTANLDYVGAFIGYGVSAPTDATIIATDPASSQPMAVAKEVDEKGRVYAFGDEWVIFANQWGPKAGATPDNQTKDAGNVCYVPASGDAAEFFHSTATLYQTKQFWYNAINYVAPPNTCFVIEDDEVVVVK